MTNTIDDNTQVDTLQKVRTQIVDAVLVLGSLFGTLSFVVLSMLNTTMDFNQSIVLGIFLLFWVGVTVFRQRIPYVAKSLTVIGTIYVTAVYNMLGWGLAGSSSILFILIILMTMSMHSTRWGLVSYALVIVTLAVSTALIRLNLLTFDTDFNLYVVSEGAWISRMIIVVLVSSMLIASIGRILLVLQEQLDQFSRRSDELAERTMDLTMEMQKREHAEEALAHAVDRLKDLDIQKDKFLDSVSHELRTPIANIQLYHQLIGMKPDKLPDYLGTLKKETERLSHIVEQMIHASSDTYDMALTTMVDVDMKHVVQNQLDQFTTAMQKRGLSLTFNAPDDYYLTLASPEHMERVLATLMDNAVKYTPQDGDIRVTMKRESEQSPEMICIAIENTSECPSEIERASLFERFVRGQSSLKMGVAGAGLGLSIARQIIQQYNGRITLSCNEERGTVIFMLWVHAIVPIDEFIANESSTSSSTT